MFGGVVKSRQMFSHFHAKKQYTNPPYCAILEYRLKLRGKMSRSLSFVFYRLACGAIPVK